MVFIKSFTLLLCLSGAFVYGRDLLTRSNKICARGQSYWCQNITNAVECRALKHCIMAVWEKEIPIEKDESSVCQTCLDMVSQARDQLESNQTQEEIKEVLEGSCRLIPIPPVSKECIKMVDDFAPQLIDTLASQMNPQVVCSVAGLCYNERVHKLEAEYMMKLEWQQLGCDDGAAYWCKNISTAVECDKVKFCISNIWEKQSGERSDQSAICQSCVSAFATTRLRIDQSFVPEEEVGLMLESACMRIPMRQVVQECLKFMNKYMPQLLQVVTSKTESQYACVVSGLCENRRLQDIEKDYLMKRAKAAELNCPNCNAVVNEILVKFQEMSDGDFLNILMNMCAKAGSFSDGCYAMIMREHTSVLEWLRTKLVPRPVCNLVSICRKPMTKPGQPHIAYEVPEVRLKGDLPCDLCIQLVQHLRDILVSNTTEDDFKQVLKGICGQMDQWKEECTRLVDEYYTFAYEFLINTLDGQVLCKEIDLCPRSVQLGQNTLVRPLQIDGDFELSTNKPQPVQQLPIERMDPIFPLTRFPSSFVKSSSPSTCAMCEYFLHFVQQELSLPSTEEQIRNILSKECSKLPQQVQDPCEAFIETYMDMLIALLVQEIDPSQICPKIGVCPGSLISVPLTDKPACPLCLLAIQEIYAKLNASQLAKTSTNIADVLDDLCVYGKFPPSISVECAQFISRYHENVINMVMTEFSPQESCTYIDICQPVGLHESSVFTVGNTKTNEIRESPTDSGVCVLCEFVMTKLEEILKDRTTEEEIKDAVYKVCDFMPNSVRPKCVKFISQYADLLIQLLASEIDPHEVCTAINVCHNAAAIMKGPMEKCLLCEALMDGLRAVLTDPDVDQDINHQLIQACGFIPQRERDLCISMVEQLAPQIELAMRTLPVGPIICERINMCIRNVNVNTAGPGECSKGSSYWCQTTIAAAACNAIEYCQEHVWMGDKPKKLSHNLGRIVIDY